jgi:nitrate reductase NapAB chaperone NapD
MRNSTKLEEEELLHIKKQLLELQKENSELRDQLRKKQVVVVNTERLELASKNEEIKTLQKMLKNERKVHKVDLMVLTNLQTVTVNVFNQSSGFS